MKQTRETWQLTEAATTLLALGTVYETEHVRAARVYLESREYSVDDGPAFKLRQAICDFLRECEAL